MSQERCGWCTSDPLYVAYHDTEWGVPVTADAKLFEMLVLEGFQAGLSWITILRKRKNFRSALDGFDASTIANYGEGKVQELIQDAGIIRNKLKIRATIGNAREYLKLQKSHGSFSAYLWAFVENEPLQNQVTHYKEAPATTAISDALSKDLKTRGFKFVGPTIVYALMQAVGMVNDHESTCFRQAEVKNIGS